MLIGKAQRQIASQIAQINKEKTKINIRSRSLQLWEESRHVHFIGELVKKATTGGKAQKKL